MDIKLLEVTVCKTDTGYSAHIEDVLGVVTTGKTLVNIEKNMYDALNGHLTVMKEDGGEIPDFLQQEYELVFKMDV